MCVYIDFRGQDQSKKVDVVIALIFGLDISQIDRTHVLITHSKYYQCQQ